MGALQSPRAKMAFAYAVILTAMGLTWYWFYELLHIAGNVATPGVPHHMAGFDIQKATFAVLGVLAFLFGLRHGLTPTIWRL